MGNNQSQSSTPRKESPTAPTNDSTLPSTIVVDLDKRLLQSLEDSTPCPLSIPSPPLPPRNSPFSQYAVSPDPRELLDDLPSEPSSRPGHRRSASFDNLTYNSQKKSAPEPPVVVSGRGCVWKSTYIVMNIVIYRLALDVWNTRSRAN
mgnify:CR=1 FL=1